MPRGSDITIKDIAKRLGVSFSTVAKALKDDPVVAEETRKRVHQTAKEMGYFPNLMATGLRSKETRSIGIILNDIENPTRSYIIKKISMAMVQHGFTPFIFDSSYDQKLEQQNIINLLSRLPECILVSPVKNNLKNIKLLKNFYDRTIILSKENESVPTSYVHMDHVNGGYIAAKTMIEMGHTQNLIIMEPPDYPSAVQFCQGVNKAYQEKGIPTNQLHFFYSFPNMEGGVSAVKEYYDRSLSKFTIPITGIIASNDLMAIGVYKAALELGIKIPEDISVIGYDDLPIASLVTPQLSTLSYPKEKIAEHCTNIILAKLIDHDTTNFIYSLEPDLILRDSISDRS